MNVALIAVIAVALAFDFVNGFHDAVNSIATVVSTRVLSPRMAVAWAAFFNFVAFLVFKTKVASTIAKGVVQRQVGAFFHALAVCRSIAGKVVDQADFVGRRLAGGGGRRGLAECARFVSDGGRGMVGIHAAFTCSDATLDAALSKSATRYVNVSMPSKF